ncbi:MAG TPA: TetR/AcrR family transcriptional regulator [Vicinamibacterales bacterium]|jgi:AcrR family transcriptional regulator|nr:TetR/AcrR family transcriptional regulator [Vicinamibacterales bacterium]
MSSPARRTKAHVVSDFRRAQILQAARQSVIRHGIAATTVDGIARSAGVAKGTVYLYYRSKDDILRQLVGQDLAEFQHDTVPGITGPGTVDARLRAFFQATLAFFERHRDFLDQCQIEMSLEVRRKARQRVGLVFAAQVDAWRDALATAARGRRVRTVDADGAARAIVSFAHGLAVQRLRGWCTTPIDSSVDRATTLIWQGLVRR